MTINYLLNSKKVRFRILAFFSWIPDLLWIKILYRIKNGYWMDFNNPKRFNEKIQWLKIFGFRPEYTQMVDKYAVKEFVALRIGSEYVIPTLAVWDKPEDIEWDKLPGKFVLKTTHGGGSYGVVICKDKSVLDKKRAIADLNESMAFTVGNTFRERPYLGIVKRVIAEQLLEPKDNDDLCDYKFYCFNGEPKFCQVIRDRKTKETIDFFDMEWNHMPFVGLNPGVSNGISQVLRPCRLEDMKNICKKLAENIPFVRIDLYEVNTKVYFGEITFYPASGFGAFSPAEWNLKLGDMIELNSLK